MPRTWVQTGVNSAGDPVYERHYTENDEYTNGPEAKATGAAADLAQELGVDLSSVKGTGRGGKITKPDVEAAAAA